MEEQTGTPAEPVLTEAQYRTAMKDPEHLRRWVADSRPFIILVGNDFVPALRFPDGHKAAQDLFAAYRAYRLKIPTGDLETVEDPLGNKVEAPIFKNDRLTVEEMDRAIRWLIGQITDAKPYWSLSDAPL